MRTAPATPGGTPSTSWHITTLKVPVAWVLGPAGSSYCFWCLGVTGLRPLCTCDRLRILQNSLDLGHTVVGVAFSFARYGTLFLSSCGGCQADSRRLRVQTNAS